MSILGKVPLRGACYKQPVAIPESVTTISTSCVVLNRDDVDADTLMELCKVVM